MIPTVHHFLEALSLPRRSLATLSEAQPVLRWDGSPAISRTTSFAEAEIVLNGAAYLLCCPLGPTAIPAVERTAARLKYIRSEFLTPYRILRREMRFTDALGRESCSDLILHALPAGTDLARALASGCDGEAVVRELTRMEEEFRRIGFVHGNLKAANVVLTPSHGLVAVRYHRSRFGEGSDSEAFEQLRRRALEHSACGMLHDCPAPLYRASEAAFDRHKWVSHMAEQLILVEDETGYGYVDGEDRTVIEPQFHWANDFHEGRAEVQLASGLMGLIDKQGRYVIEPRYRIVEFDENEGTVHVCRDGKWALFDYEGRPLSDFVPLDELNAVVRV